jgi:Asp-tRNA(Asn)/Glu-tRNA(Gln) amidotransferase A subunit family amidase
LENSRPFNEESIMRGTTFTVEEATIDSIHQAFKSRKLTARRLIEIYLDRIETIDRSGPALNSIITVNPTVLDDADKLDRHFAATGQFIGPLHGIATVVKDQFETKGIMTTFGSAAQNGYVPVEDATIIVKLKAAGALILGKTTLSDYATSWFSTCSQQGETKNPYALDYDCGGSSSGTAAAVAANLATIGLGGDTGGSIRLPASFSNLVGFRVTPGLISRHGMSPLVVSQDTAGPMTRTVRDTAIVLDTLVGYDSADEYTAAAVIGGRPGSYAAALDPLHGLEGARIGVVRNALDSGGAPTASAVNALIEGAIGAMRQAGAEIVDIEIPSLIDWIVKTSIYLLESKHYIDSFLASRPGMPTRSLDAVRDTGKFDPSLDLLIGIFAGPTNPGDDPEYHSKLAARTHFQKFVIGILAQNRLDAMVYPAVRILPPSKADLRAGKYDCLNFPTNTLIASQTLMPSICVPAGFSAEGLPVGMEIVTFPYREADLLRFGSAFEHATGHRRSPGLGVSA